MSKWWLMIAAGWLLLLASGCRSYAPRAIPGDEIIVTGKRFHTGTRVVTWHEPGGYDAYAGRPALRARAFATSETPPEWTVRKLKKGIDQFVLHYDACGLSKVCFDVLHARGLSVHFLLDVDGTIYQTLDLQERALHATTSNDRSIGIEIANIGAYPPNDAKPLERWYRRDAEAGGAVLTVPASIKDARIRTPDFVGRPARPDRVSGKVQGKTLQQYDFTPEQYAALVKLTAALCEIFPKLRCDFPRDGEGEPLAGKLPDEALARYRGILGHYHLQENKVDPGPAFQWERFLEEVRRLRRSR